MSPVYVVDVVNKAVSLHLELLRKDREGGGLISDKLRHTLGITSQQLLGNDGAGRSSKDKGGLVAGEVHDQSLGIIGIGLQAVLEVLLADEKALRVPPAVLTHNNEAGGEELSHTVEDAATAVGTGYKEEKRTLRAE
ncbi:hypothetical protein FOBRF1_013728 [Fusarium oxysporum]